MLPFAILFISLALVLYTLGVWGEKLQGALKPWHLAVFWAGLACDAAGTALMGMLAESVAPFSFHAVTGAAAILLMLLHAVWATVVLARKNQAMVHVFHRFSLAVWVIWLVPYISGLVAGMGR